MAKNVKPGAHSLSIGFDLDGVIIDHTENKIKKARELGFNIKPEQTPSYCLRKIIGGDQYYQIQKYIYGPGTASGLLMTGARPVLEKLKQIGWYLFIISRRQPKFRPGAFEWLAKNLPGVFEKANTIFVQQDYNKNTLCQKLGVQIYLDDKVSVLRKLNNVSQKYWFNQYRIKTNFVLREIKEVFSWPEFLKYITKG